ncbi:anucleate primary sterigmata protein A [Podospora conica]|nr:anucleate primary sterigmata protein A [Schizothecium conicum]
MATSIASEKPIGVYSSGDVYDPFVTSPSGTTSLRHSAFDSQLLFSPNASADHVKRALEAHLRDTERRMEEAGKLGTSLVQQRKELTDRLREVEQLQSEGELNPDLRQRLVEIEKDYNDVARESARAFLPKQRIPSNEAAQGSPFAPEGKGGRRSVSPSKFESLATGSPTKLSVPNRKLRNQPTNRIHDIEFAAEISTSLISQVRSLQALLAEREEELRDIKVERSRLELDTESLQQRMKTLDESENRYKDENWNLETQMREMTALQKDTADGLKKLQQSFNVLQAEKNTTQRELEEVKDNLAKQDEKHAATIKNLEIELGTSRRSAAILETERTTMQRKVEDLMTQNQELARAVSTQRVRAAEREAGFGASEDELQTATDNATPEQSPPPSPVKGTPRHSVLESETLKTSLGHAQRTIQTLRTNIHREKTEKLELKRMLQDLRDELEKARSEPNPPARRSRKSESREFKKPSRLGQLGGTRSSRTEVYVEDPEWEDNVDTHSPTSWSPAASTLKLSTSMVPIVESASDHFETANEASESAFETAQERGTETEDFQTGAEDLSDDDAATETEASPSKGAGRLKRPPSLPMNHSRYSFESTASTSDDGDDYTLQEVRTPTGHPTQKMRLRVSRGALTRRSRGASEEPNFQSSPASFVADNAAGTPQQGAQSLFAELGDFEGSDDDSYVGVMTPSRRSIRSVTPGSYARGRASPPPEVPALPKLIMVDSGMMTEPLQLDPPATSTEDKDNDQVISPQSVIFHDRPMSMASVVDTRQSHASTQWLGQDFRDEFSRPLSTVSYSDASVQNDHDLDAKLAQFPSPPTSPPKLGLIPTPILPPPQTLSVSHIRAEDIEPFDVPSSPPSLSMSSILSEDTEPLSEPEVEPPALSISSLVFEQVEPQAEPEPVPAPLTMSTLLVEQVEPLAEPQPVPVPLSLTSLVTEEVEPRVEPEPAPIPLSLTTLVTQEVEPHSEPEPAPAPLTLTSLVTEEVEPQSEPEPTPTPFSMSAVVAEQIEPVVEPESPRPPPIVLSLSGIQAEQVEPVELSVPSPVSERGLGAIGALAVPVTEKPAPVPLALSTILSEEVEPRSEPVTSPVQLSFAPLSVAEVEPREEPEQPRPVFSLSFIEAQHVEPFQEPETPLPAFSISSIEAQQVEPRPEPKELPPALSIASIEAQHVEPQEAPFTPPPALGVSSIQAQEIAPLSPVEPPVTPPSLSIAAIQTLESKPIEPAPIVPAVVPSVLSFSSLGAIDIEPVSPRTPKRNGFIIPRDRDTENTEPGRPQTPPGFMRGLESLVRSTDEGSTSHRVSSPETCDQSAQTSLTAEAIDEILNAKNRPFEATGLLRSNSVGSAGTPSTVRIHRPQQPSTDSATRLRGKPLDAATDPFESRRPGSAASARSALRDAPPLPPNHKEVIEAARTSSSSGGQGTIGTMGPPLFPASALRVQNSHLRPRTPNDAKRPMSPVSIVSGRHTPTPRVARGSSTNGAGDVHSPTHLSHLSRKSSVSSFASELESRFNMQNEGGFDPHGFGPNTDPRMIQAITQTMIGEYLWKYTRKPGRGEMSGNRHRRYFWVHPYTRTLYWSDRDPTAAGRAELKAKSVPIEAVRVVTDDNPMPPGLHRKSLVIVSPGRTIKFTCTTGQRHETWFNALSYLLLRTNDEGQTDTEEMAGNITREDVDEFNPSYGRRVPNGNRPPAASLSSYNSRTLRTESPVMDMSIPTLTPTHYKKSIQSRPSGTLTSRISGYFGSLRSRSVSGRDPDHSIYEASEVPDSAEDVRQIIERQDREADRLENVRACCDGKHDVGTLTGAGHRRGRYPREHSHTHAQSGPSVVSTPAGTVRARA